MRRIYSLLYCMLLLPFALTAKETKADGVIEADENIIFYSTAAYRNVETGTWYVPVRGRVYEPADSTIRLKAIKYALSKKYGLSVTDETDSLFEYRVNLLLTDNERGKSVRIRLANSEYLLPETAADGSFSHIITLTDKAVGEASENGIIRYEAILSERDRRKFTGYSFTVEPQGLSVISDIDDTIKISSVLKRKELLESTFYKNFQAVDGMSHYYRLLAARGASFHFVSSSPWQLYEPLHHFLEENSFPPGTFHLKDFRFKDKTLLNLFKDGDVTKPPLIRAVLQKFPGRKFILIGDSGEKDPEVYAEIMKEFPDQIESCLIRNVTAITRDDPRLKTAFKGVPDNKWQLFEDGEDLLDSDIAVQSF